METKRSNEKANQAKKLMSDLRYKNSIAAIIELRKKNIGFIVISRRLESEYGIKNESTGKLFSQSTIRTFLERAKREGIYTEESV